MKAWFGEFFTWLYTHPIQAILSLFAGMGLAYLTM